MKLTIKSVVILVLALCSSGQTEINCAKVKPVTDFFSEDIFGVWYVLQQLPNKMSSILKCCYGNITSVNPNRIDYMVNGIQKSNGNVFVSKNILTPSGVPNEGKFVCDLSITNVHEIFPLSLVAAAPKKYLLWYGCDEDKQQVYSYLFSKQKKIPDDVLEEVRVVLNDYGINLDNYEKVDQEGCTNFN